MTGGEMTGKPPVAVIGAGLMGHGIAYRLARAGHAVSVQDPSEEARRTLPGRLAAIAALLGDDPALVADVRVSADLAETVAEAGLVVEAAPERIALKQALFAELERLAPAEAILASNTSAIPIATFAETVVDTARVVGTHFWNPPHLVPLVEVVQLAEANAPAVARVIALLGQAGWRPVHVRKDIPGFIGNRLQHALKREAIALVAAGVCDAETIDAVVKDGFGARMGVLGPMEQTDLVGLDLSLAIQEVLIADLDRSDSPQAYLAEKVAAGKLGVRTGEGFRTWTPEEVEALRRRLNDALVAAARRRAEQDEG